MRTGSSWIISFSVRLYQWLLYIGPAGFRHEYGLPMVQVFRECCRDAYQRRGTRGVVSLWSPTFSDLVVGMIAEHFSSLGGTRELDLYERLRQMLRTMRRSMITIFCAFVVFGLAWLFFARMNDPLSWWEPIVRLHPEVGWVYSVIVNAGYVAFLMILLGGLPIIFVAIKQAFAARRRDVLALFGVAALMVIVFTVVVILVLTGHWGFDPNGGIFFLVFLAFLLVVTVAVARAVLRSELSERVLRFALAPYIVVTAAMGVALLATFVEAWLLSMYTPEAFAGTVTPDWVIADLMMVVAMGVAGWALWRGLRARGGRVVAA
jgi:hypothetical protein